MTTGQVPELEPATDRSRPTVSIALATFNGLKFIEAQLESLLRQTHLPIEILISDDCSNDGTYELLESLAVRSPVPIKLHRNETRLGWRKNFLETMSRCSGELIAFCDQDDIWQSNKLEVMCDVFTSDELVMAFHNAMMVDQSGVALRSLGKPPTSGTAVHGPLSLDFWTPILGFTIVFRRDILRFSKFWGQSIDKLKPGENAPHDEWVFFIASVLGNIAYVDQHLVNYRLHGGNTVGFRSTRKTLSDHIAVYRGSGEKLLQRIRVVKNRLDVLSIVSEELDRKEFGIALAAYRAHLGVNERRLKLYQSTTMAARLQQYLKMLASGDYTSSRLPLGRGEKFRDLAVAVLGVKGLHTPSLVVPPTGTL